MAAPQSSTREDLLALLEARRREGAPPVEIAELLYGLLGIHLGERDLTAARATLQDFTALRGDAEADVFEALCAARLARAEANQERAAWLAQRAVRLSRAGGLVGLLPHALVAFAEATEALDRYEEARAARAEAAALFERQGECAYAAVCLLYLHYLVPEEEQPELLKRARALVEHSGPAFVVAWTWQAQGRRHKRRGEYLPARHAFERALALSREPGGRDQCDYLMRLAGLEHEACHNDDALRFVEEALACAVTPEDRASALCVRAEVLGQVHRHREARADALAAERVFLELGDAANAADARKSARRERLRIFMHRLPRWLFTPRDAVLPEGNQEATQAARVISFFGGLAQLLSLLWFGGWVYLSRRATERALQVALGLVGLLPLLLLGVVAVLFLVATHRGRASR